VSPLGTLSPIGENFTPPNFPQSDLGCQADSRWALPQISSLSILHAIISQEM